MYRVESKCLNANLLKLERLNRNPDLPNRSDGTLILKALCQEILLLLKFM